MNPSPSRMKSSHSCSGMLPDGSDCPTCAPIGRDRAKTERIKMIHGEVRTNEDILDHPDPGFTPSGNPK